MTILLDPNIRIAFSELLNGQKLQDSLKDEIKESRIPSLEEVSSILQLVCYENS